MKNYKNFSLKEYCKVLSARTPVPGGGSAAALAGALGASLLAMVAEYSLGRGLPARDETKTRQILNQARDIRDELLDCVDRDARAYLKVVNARKASARVKRTALKAAAWVPQDVCRLCYSAVHLMPWLVRKGNPRLMSDIEVAMELLVAAYKSAKINVLINSL